MRRGFTRRWSTPPRDIESRANTAIAIRRAAHCARDSRRADHNGGHAAPVRYAVDVDAGFWPPQDRTPTHGYEPTRETAMAFAKSWKDLDRPAGGSIQNGLSRS